MLLVIVAISLYLIGDFILLSGYATVSIHSTQTIFNVGERLRFFASVVAFTSLTLTAWRATLAEAGRDAWETAAAAAATMVIAIGFLSEPHLSASMIQAIGNAGWSALLIFIGLRQYKHEQRIASEVLPAQKRTASYWLISAGGILLFSVGSGLPASQNNKLLIVSGILTGVGLAVVGGTLLFAHRRGILKNVVALIVAISLEILACSSALQYIVIGAFAHENLTAPELRIGLIAAIILDIIGMAVLGWAASVQAHGLTSENASWFEMRSTHLTPLGAPRSNVVRQITIQQFARTNAFCSHCGTQINSSGHFCTQCGSAISQAATDDRTQL